MDSKQKEDTVNKINAFMPEEDIYIDEPMCKHTTFRIGGNADIFVKIRSIEQIKQIIQLSRENKISLQILGNGSNVLVKDKGIRGIVAKICMESYTFINSETVKVDAGMLNGKLSRVLLENSLSGFEFASGIPGTIGGAIKMNAGAYGSQMSDIVVSTSYIDLKDENIEIKELNNTEHEFEYRKSFFSGKDTVILNTTLKFTKANREDIQAKINENNQSRKEKQPTDKPSAGSTFKRGNGFITAQLIDQCGLKGITVGGAQVSEKHAGFVINTGNATAEDVIELTNEVKEKVFEKFQKDIELEIEIIGE